MLFKNKAKEAAKEIVAAFQNPNELPVPLAHIFIHRNDNVPCRKWSWRNQLITAIRGHSDARGFRQWEQAGRTVKKGEKSFRILSPLAKKFEDKKTEKERTMIYGFRGTPVFGIDQTEGEEIPNEDVETTQWMESLPLRDVADDWGLTVEAFNGKGARFLGQYRHGEAIAIGVKNLSTWCHELVHAADDRNGTMTKSKIRREVVAEIGGAVLLRILGQDCEADLGGCWEYIQRYAAKENEHVLNVCGKVLNRTCDAVALILDTAEALTPMLNQQNR